MVGLLVSLSLSPHNNAHIHYMKKKEGGLGMRNSRIANNAFMMKINWELCSNLDALWVQLVRGQYKCGVDGFPRINCNNSGSNLWHGICQTWEAFRGFLTWDVGNGEDTRFWSDNWVPNLQPIMSYIPNMAGQIDLRAKVSDFVNPNGGWNVILLNQSIPSQIINRVTKLPVPSVSRNQDVYLWMASSDGVFSTASAYRALHGNQTHGDQTLFQLVWKWKGPERIRHFLWKLALCLPIMRGVDVI